MSDFEKITKSFDDNVNKVLGFFGKDNNYISAAVSLLLIIYASLAAPKLPKSVAQYFDYVWVKILIFFLIAIAARHRPTVAIIAAIGVIVSLQTLNYYKVNTEMLAVVKNTNVDLGLEGVPPYTYSIRNVPVGQKVYQPVMVDKDVKFVPTSGRLEMPVSQVPDNELKSLCQKMYVVDQKNKNNVIGGCNFSEMANSQNACRIAQHQYEVPSVPVQHTAIVQPFNPNDY